MMKISDMLRQAAQAERAAGGGAFKRLLASNPEHKNVKLDPKVRKKALMAIYKKYKQMGDGSIKGGKHEIMDAGDGYQHYTLEDMSDGELVAFGKWKGIFR